MKGAPTPGALVTVPPGGTLFKNRPLVYPTLKVVKEIRFGEATGQTLHRAYLKVKEKLLTILSGTQKKNLLVTDEIGLDANIKRNKVLLIILFLNPFGQNSKRRVGF
jgi:hypothetical protein